jgi:putative phosphonate catabolism associated alcohol dehydrogenase
MVRSDKNRARSLIFQGAGQPFAERTLPLPDRLDTGQVLVAISLATICGSDLHTVDGRRAAPIPCVLGHEAVGRVIDSARPGIAVGQRVTWSLVDSCGYCTACTCWGLPQKCERLFKYGHAGIEAHSGLSGCYSSHIVLQPGTAIIPVPDNLTDAVAAPINCALATIVSATRQLPAPCERVLVQGAGLLGLYACAWLNCVGVKEVYCLDPNPRRLENIANFGGKPITLEMLIPEVDLVIEVAGDSAVVSRGLAALRPGGMYIWAGMVHPKTPVEFTGDTIVRKCINILGVHNYRPSDLQCAAEFLSANQHRFPFDKLVSPPVPLQDLDFAFQLARQQNWLRVSVSP